MTPPARPTTARPTMTRQEELQYHRRLILGLMTTLEARGLLTQTEINVIIGAAQQAATPAPEPARTTRPAPAKVGEPERVPVIDLNME